MLPIERCREILNAGQHNVRYSDEEVEAVRDFLYALARALGTDALSVAGTPHITPHSRGS